MHSYIKCTSNYRGRDLAGLRGPGQEKTDACRQWSLCVCSKKVQECIERDTARIRPLLQVVRVAYENW